MKRILIFSTNYFPNIGGAEVAVKEITDRLSACVDSQAGLPDMEFDMVVPRINKKNPKHEKIGNVNIYRIGFGSVLDKFIFPKLAVPKAFLLHKKHKYNATWSIMASQASIASAFFKMRYKNIPLILTLQEGDEEEHLKRYAFGNKFLYKHTIKPWYLLVFKYADYVTVISNYLKDRAIKNGVSPGKINIIPNGVDVKQFSSTGENIQLKQKLGIKENEKIIITTSRLVKKNAVGDLIDAMRYLPENTKLLILGTGAEEETLKAKAYKLYGRVKFLGNINHKEVPSYLHISDVFARPSLSEGMGNSFIEAMAAGVPVVATPVGGIPEFLENEKTGLFCEVNNPKSIAVQISRYLSEAELRASVISNAQKMVVERYDWDIIAKEMREKVFSNI